MMGDEMQDDGVAFEQAASTPQSTFYPTSAMITKVCFC